MPFNDPWNWGWGAQPAQWEQQLLQQEYSLVLAQLAHSAPLPVSTPEPDEEGTMLNEFKVGTDPEFMFISAEGLTVPAMKYFGHDGEIGFDHGGRVAEFRPGPSKGVYPIIRKLHALINSPKVVNTGNRLRAGAICNNDCLGGHIHFGFNAFQLKPGEGCSVLTGGQFNERGAKVTKALDALTKTLEHLDILPKNESAKRRASAQGQGNHYGAYGDVRDCRGHMEYRTMASWLYDPKVAFLCLTAAKLAACDPDGAYEALKDCKSFAGFSAWLNQYKEKDLNAKRASEKLLDKGLPQLQVDPSVDFRGRWEVLGV